MSCANCHNNKYEIYWQSEELNVPVVPQEPDKLGINTAEGVRWAVLLPHRGNQHVPESSSGIYISELLFSVKL